MTWQEELRKLDEDFSSGQLTADEYRARRDQVLSSAVAPSGQQPPSQQDTSGPPATEQATGEGGSSADSTQVIAPVSAPLSGWQEQGSEATQAVSPQDAERTQAVPYWQGQQQGPASPPAGFPQTWNAPEEDVSPPWGGSEFPPLAPSGSNEWVSQGPEVFADSHGAGKGKIIGGVVALLLLVGIAFGAWWLWGRDAGSGTGTEPTAAAPTAEQPPAEPEKLPIGQFEGTAEPRDDIDSFSQVPGLNYLNPTELAAYEKADAGEVNFHVQNLPSNGKAVLLLTETADAKAAEATAKKLSEIQVGNGAKTAVNPPKGVYVTEYTDPGKGFGQIRAHYVSGNVVVRIEVQSSGGLSAARADFARVLDAQLDVLPADA